jgi:hypothetical protein
MGVFNYKRAGLRIANLAQLVENATEQLSHGSRWLCVVGKV